MEEEAHEVNSAPLEELLRHFQQQQQLGAVERADAGLEKAELDAQIGELESRLDAQQKLNTHLFRRVEMLEEVLQQEKHKHVQGVESMHTPRKCKTLGVSMEDLRQRLLEHKVFASTRIALKSAEGSPLGGHRSKPLAVFCRGNGGSSQPESAPAESPHRVQQSRRALETKIF
ncbi:unnamed protein product [Effrenium voratum]|uniref:Striatin N-terminal domain-containing protein n=1 Tax=Effrenium voratum TaxID=2562239 RepID=A0AA36N8U7_9DINO|nr:unnamed protein product [Effrenium voratum]